MRNGLIIATVILFIAGGCAWGQDTATGNTAQPKYSVIYLDESTPAEDGLVQVDFMLRMDLPPMPPISERGYQPGYLEPFPNYDRVDRERNRSYYPQPYLPYDGYNGGYYDGYYPPYPYPYDYYGNVQSYPSPRVIGPAVQQPMLLARPLSPLPQILRFENGRFYAEPDPHTYRLGVPRYPDFLTDGTVFVQPPPQTYYYFGQPHPPLPWPNY